LLGLTFKPLSAITQENGVRRAGTNPDTANRCGIPQIDAEYRKVLEIEDED